MNRNEIYLLDRRHRSQIHRLSIACLCLALDPSLLQQQHNSGDRRGLRQHAGAQGTVG
jgi:hypothetical protein